MQALIRDATVGQLIRYATGNKYLRYPEEEPSFQLPESYTNLLANPKSSEPEISSDENDLSQTISKSEGGEELSKLETVRTQPDGERVGMTQALSRSSTRAALERRFTEANLERGPSVPIAPTKTSDGKILVDWYSTDDPANPQNWSFRRKAFVATQIYIYTMFVYMGSAIYSPSIEGVMKEFGVNVQAASLGLSMYVLAYGIGPMLFSPLSEIPYIGRNPPYIITLFIYVIVTIPSALVDNFAGLIVLRFLQGFFGSPCLATGGASLQDMYSLIKIPYVLSLWAFAATCGPALGPIISGFSVTAMGWRWSLWEILWMTGPTLILLFMFLPETSGATILLRRAERLRKLTGNDNIRSQSEIDQAKMNVKEIAIVNVIRPMQMMVLDPAVGFTAIYTALIYGIYYSFFEAFPIVYIEGYHMNLGEMGLTFLSITVGVIVGTVAYWAYVYFVTEPDIRKNGLGAPEKRLIPALYASFLCPVGLFIFAWTADPRFHWIASVIGITLFTVGIFIVMQCIFLYLPLTYPQYAASLFAGNDLTRSTLATGAIHFSRPLFADLGVARGVSLLSGLTCGCIFGMFYLFWKGDMLRSRSKFAAK